MKQPYLAAVLIILMPIGLWAQILDTAHKKNRHNIIKTNLTNPILFGSRSFVFSYERVLKHNQSIVIALGQVGLPGFGVGPNTDSVNVTKNGTDKGFHFSAEYRFYLKKENKYSAPRGVYIAPYISYNDFSRGTTWRMNTSSFNGDVNTNLGLNIKTAGVELGYQFILWKRVALDFVMIGPGISSYSFNAGITTNLSPEQKELFFQRLNEFLEEKIPGYSLAINEGEFKRRGSMNTTSFGYRFMINVGFRF